MEKELKILELADYSEQFIQGDSSAYLIINKNIADHPCMFGFTKLSKNKKEATQLFKKIEAKAKQLGYKDIVGPLNYTTWMSYRWALNNYDMKLIPDCDNPSYYIDYIKDLGYDELYTYRSAMVKVKNPLYALGKIAYESKLKEGYNFKLYRGKEAYDLVKDIYEISLDAFAGSYLYSEIPFEYFDQVYLSWTRDLDLSMFVAFNPEGRAVGYVVGYMSPDGKMFISKTSAVLKEYQKNKVYTALLYLGSKYVQDLGFDEMLYHFQCEQRGTFKRFDNKIESNEKRYAIFKKDL